MSKTHNQNQQAIFYIKSHLNSDHETVIHSSCNTVTRGLPDIPPSALRPYSPQALGIHIKTTCACVTTIKCNNLHMIM